MGELEEKINSILSSPEELEKITKLAQSFLGDAGDKKETAEPQVQQTLDGILPEGMDAKSLMKMFSTLSAEGGNEKQAILHAIKPFLSEKRRVKIDKAMQISKLAKIARIALNSQTGGGSKQDV